MAWTAFLTGDLYSRKGDGPVKKLASGLPGINSLAFRKDGRLYATQVFLGDALYEIDVEGVKPPRKIMEKMGGLNGFEFGPDDMLYGPLWFKGQVAKVDVDKAELTVVADGFKIPAAVNFDSRAISLWSIPRSGSWCGSIRRPARRRWSRSSSPRSTISLIDDKDRIFVSNMADNGIQEVDPETGTAKQVIIGKLALPGGIGVVSDGAKDTIYVADVFAYRTVDGATGEVSEPARMHADGVTLEYPMSATAKGDDVLLSSWFTGTVQLIDRKTGKTKEMLHDFKAPHDAVKLGDGSILVNELGSKSLVRASGEHGKDRTVVLGNLEGPVGLVAGPGDTVYRDRSLCRPGVEGRSQRRENRGRQGSEEARRHRAGARRQADRGRGRRQSASYRSIRRTAPSPRSPATCRSACPPHPADCRATSRPASASAQPGRSTSRPISRTRFTR